MEFLSGLGGGIWTLIAFLVALSVIVAVHEYGHYIVGRWSGIRAEVFSVGFGPRLFSRRDRRGTRWQVAAIPLGGYVKFLGDSNAASAGTGTTVRPELRRQTLEGAPLWARTATLLAGPVFNFILSALIFAAFMLIRGVPVETPTVGDLAPTPPEIVNELRPGDEILAIGDYPVREWADLFTIADRLPPAAVQSWTVRRNGDELTVQGPDLLPPRIGGVAPGGAAAAAGLMSGDVVLSANGETLSRFSDLRTHVEAAAGEPLTLEIWRDGEVLDITLAPKEQDLPLPSGGYEKRWLIGVSGDAYFAPATRNVGPITAIWQGVVQVGDIIGSSLSGIWAMITGQIGACNLGGAITIAESTGQAANAGFSQFVWWIAVLSVAIGFLNLLPIPVLDGGHLAFYAWEAVTGRPPSAQALNLLTSIGFALVIGLMFFGLSNDLRC
ncbi:RIP metalloprotease RseP [Paracoccus aerodenitrificans]|uniref:RIP metalloprotease RseP n=1 Tax=Paracoccus aerodenitrificans TaxID=3017781 RepID=UPI0022F078A9|nr:RIP metalloprotease RseP [Paracoccus aerodenitrificans]WBU62661.1 RIP metalloprotease RseP [Paracoccus aerodenitrificans]